MLGVLSITFGAIVALFYLFSVVSAGAPMGVPAAQDTLGISEALEQFVDETRMASLVSSLLMLIMSASLIFIGIGQLKYKKWAVRASITWAVVALLVVVVLGAINFAVLGPAMERAFSDFVADNPDVPDVRAVRAVFSAVSTFFLILDLPYPIILLVFFRKPQVVQAMTN